MRKPISKAKRFRILCRDNFMCRYCGARGEGVALEVDHVFPVIHGGGNEEENLVTACFPCNTGKRARVLEVLPPWEPLPEKPKFKRQRRGRVFRVGTTQWEAEEAQNQTEDGALEEVYRRAIHARRTEDDDGNECEPCEYLELTIWRPAGNPYSGAEFEPHASFVFDMERGDCEFWADDFEEQAREIFDALPHHDGWTYWRGGESPLPDHLDEYRDCEFAFRDGRIERHPRHLDNPWQHIGAQGWDGRGDIIAYRVIKTAPRGDVVLPSYPIITDMPKELGT